MLMKNLDSLFDINREGAKQRSKIGKSYGLKMTEKDCNFYLDQKKESKSA